MTVFIHVEPSREQLPAFALWTLDQKPPLPTSGPASWDVPVALYAVLPPELLAGAYVDGYPFDHAQEQPASAPSEPLKAPQAASAPVVDRLPQEPVAEARKAPRKRAAKKTAGAVTRKPSEVTVSAGDTRAVIRSFDVTQAAAEVIEPTGDSSE